MCEKRPRKIRKGLQVTRLREARRMQRLRRLISTTPEVAEQLACTRLASAQLQNQQQQRSAPQVDKTAQCRLILELAWKTINLMQKNNLIQQKIVDLQKETSEFVASVMNNPENKEKYAEHIRLYSQHQTWAQAQMAALNDALKLDPKV